MSFVLERGKRRDERGSGGVQRGLCGRLIDRATVGGACLRGVPLLRWEMEVVLRKGCRKVLGSRSPKERRVGVSRKEHQRLAKQQGLCIQG